MTNKNLILGIDIDGVLADWVTAYAALTVQTTGKDLFPRQPYDWLTWDFDLDCGYTKEEGKATRAQYWASPYWWLNLQPYPNIQAIIDFANQNPTYFITARMGLDVKRQTELWLIERGIALPTVLITADKAACCRALKVTHYIDDSHLNCLDVYKNSPNTDVTILNQPWNRNAGLPSAIRYTPSVRQWVSTIESHEYLSRN